MRYASLGSPERCPTEPPQPATRRTEVEVDASAEHAFRVFTEGIGSWWDDDTAGAAALISVALLPAAGGIASNN